MIGEIVTRLRGVSVEPGRRNDESMDWSSPDSLDIQGVAVAPVALHPAAAEDLDGRDEVIEQLELYMPAGSDVTALDRMVVRGETFDVVGTPAVWINPFTKVNAGTVATVRREVG